MKYSVVSLCALTLLGSAASQAQSVTCSIWSAGTNVLVSWTGIVGKHYEVHTAITLAGTWSNAYNPVETWTYVGTEIKRSFPIDRPTRLFRVAEVTPTNIPPGMVFVPGGSFQ